MKLVANEAKQYCSGAMLSIMTYMLGGTILQAFMAECGIREERIGIFVSVMQIVQLGVITLLSPLMDKIKKVLLVNALFPLLAIPTVILCLYLCVERSMTESTAFLLLIAAGLLWNVAYGIYSVVTYKVPYHIIDMKYYGRLMSCGGAISGLVGVVFSSLMTYMQGRFDYFNVMLAFYGVCIAVIAVYIIVSLSFKECGTAWKTSVGKSERGKVNLLKYKPFSVLVAPNLLRGFCLGVFGMAATVGYYFGILDGATASVMVVINSVVNIFSSIIFEKLNNALGTGNLILSSSILLAASLPLMLIGQNATVFLIFFGLAAFSINVVNCSVPVAVVKIIDYEVAGSYNGYRMMLNTCGSALSGFVFLGLCKLCGGVVAMVIAGACQIFSGVAYYLYLKRSKDAKGVSSM